ncbi:MAG TPA: hypothetical protein VNT26_17115, partial [Candidatus Sulfotelmatobacter sp.]|nr:hypothetical protein [Candidatus Sulfotelmatobacter sp.]
MKPPPLLLGATLLFWGWQTGLLIPGVIMALALEGARFVQTRWEFSNEDFTRIWTFCTLIFLATTVFAFTNEGAADFRNLFQNPSLANQRNASTATARTAAALIRWLPMIFFLFVAAQTYSSRAGIPLETISLILRRRWKKARQLGQPVPPGHTVNVAYPYLALCLFGASTHARENDTFFWGVCGLLAWALWSLRSRRFGLAAWAGALVVVIGLGFLGQAGVNRFQHYFDNFNAEWLASLMRRRFVPAQTKTALGAIGRLKASGQIVIRLECPVGVPPSLLREASYQLYNAPVWSSEQAEREFDLVQHDLTNDTTWVLVPGKTNSAAVRIACYLEGGKALLPLPSGSGSLENLPAYGLQKSGLGAVLAEGPGLVLFDAL